MNRISQIACALLFALVASCTQSSESAPTVADAANSTDAGRSDASLSDAAADVSPDVVPDANPPDANQSDADAGVEMAWHRAELADGSAHEGELVATYDMSRWWAAEPGLLHALFDPRLYAPYPDDRSFRFVRSDDLVSLSPTAAPSDVTPYREFLRERGIAFQRPPFGGPAYVITGNETYHLEEDGFGDFAFDFVRTDDAGIRYTGFGVSNEDFLVWGEPVYSGVAGEVIEVVANGVDNTPGAHPEPGIAVNNLVGIALGGSFYAYYLHFREMEVDPAVVLGAQVEVADELGVVGNSGVSLEPHLHVVLLWYDVRAQRSYSVPVEFSTIDVSDSADGLFESQLWSVPTSGTWVIDTQ